MLAGGAASEQMGANVSPLEAVCLGSLVSRMECPSTVPWTNSPQGPRAVTAHSLALASLRTFPRPPALPSSSPSPTQLQA